jgi:two-component system, chemotaxis family, response regulator Rcp1
MPHSTKSLKIIVADDDEEDIFFVKECLMDNHLPAEIIEAGNGETLLTMLRKGAASNYISCKPDLILMDINMPKKNGLETLREIKADANLSAIPVIILSTSQSPGDIQRAKDLGATCYLTKPQTATEWQVMISKLGVYWSQGSIAE